MPGHAVLSIIISQYILKAEAFVFLNSNQLLSKAINKRIADSRVLVETQRRPDSVPHDLYALVFLTFAVTHRNRFLVLFP